MLAYYTDTMLLLPGHCTWKLAAICLVETKQQIKQTWKMSYATWVMYVLPSCNLTIERNSNIMIKHSMQFNASSRVWQIYLLLFLFRYDNLTLVKRNFKYGDIWSPVRQIFNRWFRRTVYAKHKCHVLSLYSHTANNRGQLILW